MRLNTKKILAVADGNAIPRTAIPDEAFASGMLGDGYAVDPLSGVIYSPASGRIDSVTATRHAYTIHSDDGLDILVHVGIDTVNLQGKHYTVHAAAGDKVKKGQLLIEFDKDAIAEAGYDTITPVVVCNSDDYNTFRTNIGKAVTNADAVIELAK